mmetsp:Transcript_19658/g.42981  ORF Transcript_19658/g.42981 Transcript_19658/m.42981 type:complete len:688 (+) Transcript_19658:182-2245(+)
MPSGTAGTDILDNSDGKYGYAVIKADIDPLHRNVVDVNVLPQKTVTLQKNYIGPLPRKGPLPPPQAAISTNEPGADAEPAGQRPGWRKAAGRGGQDPSTGGHQQSGSAAADEMQSDSRLEADAGKALANESQADRELRELKEKEEKAKKEIEESQDALQKVLDFQFQQAYQHHFGSLQKAEDVVGNENGGGVPPTGPLASPELELQRQRELGQQGEKKPALSYSEWMKSLSEQEQEEAQESGNELDYDPDVAAFGDMLLLDREQEQALKEKGWYGDGRTLFLDHGLVHMEENPDEGLECWKESDRYSGALFLDEGGLLDYNCIESLQQQLNLPSLDRVFAVFDKPFESERAAKMAAARREQRGQREAMRAGSHQAQAWEREMMAAAQRDHGGFQQRAWAHAGGGPGGDGNFAPELARELEREETPVAEEKPKAAAAAQGQGQQSSNGQANFKYSDRTVWYSTSVPVAEHNYGIVVNAEFAPYTAEQVRHSVVAADEAIRNPHWRPIGPMMPQVNPIRPLGGYGGASEAGHGAGHGGDRGFDKFGGAGGQGGQSTADMSGPGFGGGTAEDCGHCGPNCDYSNATDRMRGGPDFSSQAAAHQDGRAMPGGGGAGGYGNGNGGYGYGQGPSGQGPYGGPGGHGGLGHQGHTRKANPYDKAYLRFQKERMNAEEIAQFYSSDSRVKYERLA